METSSLTGDSLRAEISQLLSDVPASSGFAGIEIVATAPKGACHNNRAHVVERVTSEAHWWAHNICVAAAQAASGAKSSGKAQVTLVPYSQPQFEIEQVNEALPGGKRGKEITVVRISFLIGFPDRRWTGLKQVGLSPMNSELADPANWE